WTVVIPISEARSDKRTVVVVKSLCVTRRHYPIIVDHAARHDEAVVSADDGDHFPAACLECIKVVESISKVGYIIRPGLRDGRVGCHGARSRYRRAQRDVAPVARIRSWKRAGIVVSRIFQIPSKLHRGEPERHISIPEREIGAAIDGEPDSLAG